MRADGRRSYDRILQIAADVFVEQGVSASMNEIAKRAGVGPGTLYRHFPSSEHLYDVLMKDWVDQIHGAARRAVASDRPPREVLVGWFAVLVAHITVHRGGPVRLMPAMDRPDSPLHGKCQELVRANTTVMDELVGRGDVRTGVDSLHVCSVVIGVAAVADQRRLEAKAVRPLLDVVARGLLA